MKTIQFEVKALPPSECSPNARCHWSKRYKAGREYGALVFYMAVDARNKLGMREPWERAILSLSCYFPTRTLPDEDNLRARNKPGQDALVRARLLVDDSPGHLITGPILMFTDKKLAPLTIIRLEEMR